MHSRHWNWMATVGAAVLAAQLLIPTSASGYAEMGSSGSPTPTPTPCPTPTPTPTPCPTPTPTPTPCPTPTPPPAEPSIDIRKQAPNGEDTQTVNPGGTATFEIKVTNTGDVPLKNVSVTDSKAPGCAKTIGTLGVGQTVKYTCEQTGVSSSFTNTACTSGTYDGETVSDCDDSKVKVSQSCNLSVDKTASPSTITPGPAPSCDTAGKPTSLTFEYTGGGCSASQNTQDPKKAPCSGSVNSSQSVTVAAGSKDLKKTYSVSPTTVAPGGEFTVSASKFEADSLIKLTNAGGSESIGIHTSCSQPLQVGDVFGSLTLVAFNGQRASSNLVTYTYVVTNNGSPLSSVQISDDKLGNIASGLSLSTGQSVTKTKQAEINSTTTNTVTVTGKRSDGQTCSATDSATVTVQQPSGSCDDGKPKALVFEYTGESCAASDNDQASDKFKCSGDPNGAQPVQVVYTGKDSSKISVSPSGETVMVGGQVTLQAVSTDKLPSDSQLEIRQGGKVLQSLSIHTSCSQPLNVGDQFGSLILRQFIPSTKK